MYIYLKRTVPNRLMNYDEVQGLHLKTELTFLQRVSKNNDRG